MRDLSPLVRIQIDRKAYGGTQVLADLSFALAGSEVVSMVGPSGVGKTTILRIIAGLDRDYEGHVEVVARADPPGRAAMLFQDSRLLPWQRVRDNILFGMDVRGRAPGNSRLRDLMSAVGLSDETAGLWPRQLSGGMQRRVALARALAANPDLLLLDEPFSSLDQPARQGLYEVVEKICRPPGTSGPGTVIVTHDIAEAVRLSDRIIVLSGSRPTRIKVTIPISPETRDAALGSREFGRACHDVLTALLDEPSV